MSKISFEGIGQQVATFEAAAGVTAGHVVKMADNGKVSKCSEGDDFCGVALNVRGGCAGVQLRGFVTLNCAGTETVGYVNLVADGSGGVKKAASGGVTTLVVSVDAAAKTCVVFL